MSADQDFYTVKQHDSLWKIARDHQTTVAELKKLNGISDPSQIRPGQKIALHKEVVGGFRVLILDKDRNPISRLNYRLEACGKKYSGVTSSSGETKRIVTDGPFDLVHIWLQRIDTSWKKVATVISGFGNKLTVLVSAHIEVKTKTEKHPDLPPALRPDMKTRPKAAYGRENSPPPTTNKSILGIVSKQMNSTDGAPMTTVEGDLPGLDEFLDKYVGGDLTRPDLEAAAEELKCEPGLIYAIAKQESSTSSFINIGSRRVPAILFERHQFRNHTRSSKTSPSPYEAKYPDICGPAYRRARKNRKGEWIELKSGSVVLETEIYGPGGMSQYKRLVKAYQLDKSAALQACSWGKFQIMGFNFKAAGFSDVWSFTKAMSRSDAEHIKAFLKFAKSNRTLLDGLRTKNFERIAQGHNGDNWRAINPEYASNIEKYYKEYK